MSGPLYPTKTRMALLRAIADSNGRVYYEAGAVWDKALGAKVTARVAEMVNAGWIRALAPDEPRAVGELHVPGRTYYRLTDDGKRILGGGDG